MNKIKSECKLICFIGIDGSGKTTIAKLLVQDMKRMGIDCNYFYGRYVPMLSKPILLLGKYFFLRDLNIKQYNDYSNRKNQAVNEHGSLLSLYRSILLFDYRVQLLFKIIAPRILGKVTVCDRYIYDTVINDIPKANNSLPNIKSLVDELFDIAPRPDLVFLIDTPIDLAYDRKNDTPSLDYLKERKKIYDYLAREYNMHIMDGTLSIDELISQIKECVFA